MHSNTPQGAQNEVLIRQSRREDRLAANDADDRLERHVRTEIAEVAVDLIQLLVQLVRACDALVIHGRPRSLISEKTAG